MAGRRMILSAIALPPSELKTLFRSGEGTIRRLLERPPTLRHSGWDLETGGEAESIRGERVRVASGDRKILDLYRDGTFVFSCRADDWFLAWASPSGQHRINPLALVEVTLSFAAFYKHVIADMRDAPKEIQLRVDLMNFHDRGEKSSLVPYQLGTMAQMFGDGLRVAPEDEATFSKRFRASEFDPASAAYEIVREIYLWFGITEDKIPYVKVDAGGSRVDIDAISKV